MVAGLVVFSLVGIAFILLRPRRSPYARRVARPRNGRPRGVERERY